MLLQQRNMSSGVSDVRELKIPVPWGHIAARDWGNENGHPVIALHGWLDNAGSFDTLIPLIANTLNLRIVAADLPGHGFSSHIPPGFLYHYMDSVTVIKRIINHFGWTKVSFIGHSLGAGLCAMFCSLYPGITEQAIFLDFVKPMSVPLEIIPNRSIGGIEGLLEFEEKIKTRKEPVYTKEQALKRLLESSTGELTKESANIMLKRGLRPVKDETGFVFTRDYRLRIPSVSSFTAEQHIEYLKHLNCSLLVIMASDHPGWEDQSLVKATIDMYRRNCKYFEYHEVPGGHHFHLNATHTISDIVNNFLKRKV